MRAYMAMISIQISIVGHVIPVAIHVISIVVHVTCLVLVSRVHLAESGGRCKNQFDFRVVAESFHFDVSSQPCVG